MFDLVHPQLCVNDFSGFLYASDEKKILSSLFFLQLQGRIQDMLSLSLPFCHTDRDRHGQDLRSVCY